MTNPIRKVVELMDLDRQPKQWEIERANKNVQSFYIVFSVFTGLMILMYWLEALRYWPFLKPLHSDVWIVPFVGFSMYSFLLAMYISSKEVTRWCRLKRTTRRGGRWVAIWWSTFMAILLLSMLIECIKMPRYLAGQTFIVTIAFFGSQTMKNLFVKRMMNNPNPQ